MGGAVSFFMVVGMLFIRLLSGSKLIKYSTHSCFDDEVISLLDFGIPRDAMMLRAPDTEALYEGYAQKGFGDPGVDGSLFPLGSTATHES